MKYNLKLNGRIVFGGYPYTDAVAELEWYYKATGIRLDLCPCRENNATA